MTNKQLNKFFELAVGSKVICNGYEGTVSKIHTGQLEGMADVRLVRGTVCVDITGLQLVKPLLNNIERVDSYELYTGNGRYIRTATKVVFSDGHEVKFMERIPSKTDAINQAIALRLLEKVS